MSDDGPPKREPLEDPVALRQEAREASGGKRRGRPPGPGGGSSGKSAPAPTTPEVDIPEYTKEEIFDVFGRPFRMILRAFDMNDPEIQDQDLMGWAAGSQAFFNKYRRFMLAEITFVMATAGLVGPRLLVKINKTRNAGKMARAIPADGGPKE